MTEVISLFSERDTRDELGLSSMRDAFAKSFFPGPGMTPSVTQAHCAKGMQSLARIPCGRYSQVRRYRGLRA